MGKTLDDVEARYKKI